MGVSLWGARLGEPHISAQKRNVSADSLGLSQRALGRYAAAGVPVPHRKPQQGRSRNCLSERTIC